MDREMLDDLLDTSAPARPAVRAENLRLMLADARREARPSRRYRRTAMFSATVAVLLTGGAGVATASNWLWGEGLENPDRSYSYVSATRGQCEIRYSGVDTIDPTIQGAVDRAVDDWFANTDVEAAAAPFVAKHLATLEAEQAASDPEHVPSPAVTEWQAHDLALQEAVSNTLKARGYDLDDLPAVDVPEHDSDITEWAALTWHSQLHCSGEDWTGEE